MYIEHSKRNAEHLGRYQKNLIGLATHVDIISMGLFWKKQFSCIFKKMWQNTRILIVSLEINSITSNPQILFYLYSQIFEIKSPIYPSPTHTPSYPKMENKTEETKNENTQQNQESAEGDCYDSLEEYLVDCCRYG